jgi:ASC-1-like (ASCH) protein
MELFDLRGDNVTIHTDMLAIPQFEKVWNHFKEKNEAINVLKYVIFNNHPLSIYVKSYTKDAREIILKKQLLESIEVDAEFLKETEDAFIELHDSTKEKLLRVLRETLDKMMMDLLSGIEIEKVIVLGEKTEKLLTTITKLENDIKLEISGKSKIKGGYKIGILEQRGVA